MATKKKNSKKKKATITEMQEIEKNRLGTYGSIHMSHTAYGKIWAGLLSQHFEMDLPAIPGHVVAGMMATMKVCRSVVPRAFREDNNIDAMNYTSFIPRLDPRNPDCDEEVKDGNA